MEHSVSLRNPLAKRDDVETGIRSFAKSEDLVQNHTEGPAVRGGGGRGGRWRRRRIGGGGGGSGGGGGISGKFFRRHPRDQRLTRFRRSVIRQRKKWLVVLVVMDVFVMADVVVVVVVVIVIVVTVALDFVNAINFFDCYIRSGRFYRSLFSCHPWLNKMMFFVQYY